MNLDFYSIEYRILTVKSQWLIQEMTLKLQPFLKEVKRRESTKSFRICRFQILNCKGYLQKHLVAERFVFLGDDWGFLKEGVKTYLMAPLPPLNSLTLFCLHINSLWTSSTIFVSLVHGLPQTLVENAISTAVFFTSLSRERRSGSWGRRWGRCPPRWRPSWLPWTHTGSSSETLISRGRWTGRFEGFAESLPRWTSPARPAAAGFSRLSRTGGSLLFGSPCLKRSKHSYPGSDQNNYINGSVPSRIPQSWNAPVHTMDYGPKDDKFLQRDGDFGVNGLWTPCCRHYTSSVL